MEGCGCVLGCSSFFVPLERWFWFIVYVFNWAGSLSFSRSLSLSLYLSSSSSFFPASPSSKLSNTYALKACTSQILASVFISLFYSWTVTFLQARVERVSVSFLFLSQHALPPFVIVWMCRSSASCMKPLCIVDTPLPVSQWPVIYETSRLVFV